MSAPEKATGGKRSEELTEASGPPRRARGAVGKAQSKANSPRQRRNRRAEAIRRRAEAATPKARPRHDTARSARPLILAAARKTAAQKGYEQLQVQDITAEAKISHQAFYGHFANKRHAVAIATSEELGAVAEMVMRGSKNSELWARRLLDDIDRALVETYPPIEGPSQRLRRRLSAAIRSEGGYEALRIAELVRISRIGHAEFYRRYGGKKGCLQRIYAEALGEVVAEIAARDDGADPLLLFADSLAKDPKRAELLVLGGSYLPEGPPPESGIATREGFGEMVGELLDRRLGEETPARARQALGGALLEVIRSSVIAGEAGELAGRVGVVVGGSRRFGSEPAGGELLAA